MKNAIIVLAAFATVLCLSAGASGDERSRRGIVGETAPSWAIRQWENLPDGVTSLDVSSFKDKVVYLYCFQSWCPGCHRHGFPALVEVQKHFQGNEQVAFAAIQTTFEGETVNTFANAVSTVNKFNLLIPVGQSGGGDAPSTLMKRYRTGGTPWTIIIDRQGIVRFNDFYVTPKDAIAIIGKLTE